MPTLIVKTPEKGKVFSFLSGFHQSLFQGAIFHFSMVQRCAAGISPCTNTMLWTDCLKDLLGINRQSLKSPSDFFFNGSPSLKSFVLALFHGFFGGGFIKKFTAKFSDWCETEQHCNGPTSNQSCCGHYASNKRVVAADSVNANERQRHDGSANKGRDVDAVSLWSGASLQTLGVSEVHNFPAGEQICPSLPAGGETGSGPPAARPPLLQAVSCIGSGIQAFWKRHRGGWKTLISAGLSMFSLFFFF